MEATLQQVARRPRECCNVAENLTTKQVAENIRVEHCVCGARHHVFSVDPVHFGVTGTSL
jgi:hypothetical protein